MAHIMVVDDERDIVTLLKFLLEKDAHRVSVAYNGAEALDKLGVEPVRPSAEIPDLIVLDVMMPLIDGYTVSSRLSQNARMKKTPVIILTGKGEMRDLFGFATNVATYVEKPFEPKGLRDIIAGVLAKKKK